MHNHHLRLFLFLFFTSDRKGKYCTVPLVHQVTKFIEAEKSINIQHMTKKEAEYNCMLQVLTFLVDSE